MTTGSSRYVPSLKAREAEIKALLKAPRSLDIVPLFELQPAPKGSIDTDTGIAKRSKGNTTDASYFLDDIARLWDAEMYLDISRVAKPTDRPTWWTLLTSIMALSPITATSIPVFSPEDSDATVAAGVSLAAIAGRAALRVTMYTNPGPAATAAAVLRAASTLGLHPSAVDVILDWADTMETRSLDTLENLTTTMITALGEQHGEIITLGTPESSDFVQVGDWSPKRREWWLWLRLAHAGIDVTYGDYVLYPPSDPVPAVPRYGHLRYSFDDTMYVHRRAIPAGGGGLAAAFKVCCDHLMGQRHWQGARFSKADRRLEDIAGNADKESQPGGWRQLAAEHHFALVAQQLPSPPPAPSAGTR